MLNRWLLVSVVVIVLDQLSKAAVSSHFVYGESMAVLPFFNLVLAHNTGAAFSFLSEAGGLQRWLFSAIAIVASVWIFWLLRKHHAQKLFCFALAFILALNDHRHHRITDNLLAHFAEAFFESVEGNNRFGHRPMAAGAADIIVELFHDFASALNITQVAHGNHYAIFHQSRDDGPLHAFDLKAKLRHLRNHVFAIDFTQMNHRDTVIDLKPTQGASHCFEIFAR